MYSQTSFNMMKQIRQHIQLIKHLTCCSQAQCNAIISTTSRDQVNAFSCLCLNVLNGFFPLNEKDKKTLRKYRKRIHALASKEVSLQDKQALLKGKFLKTLLKIILPGLQLLNG